MQDGHATSGRALRLAHPVSGQGLHFRLADEIHALRAELGRTSGGRAGKTLVKAGGLRATLVMLRDGITLEPQATAGGATVHVLEGQVRLHADGAEQEVSAGELVVLGKNLHDPLRAMEDAVLLVTIAWPEGAGAWDQEARAGHL